MVEEAAERTGKAPQVIFDVVCSECGCDLLIPLMRLRALRGYTIARIQVEWPSSVGADEYANVACPNCGAVLVIHASGKTTLSENRLFAKGKNAKAGNKKEKS